MSKPTILFTVEGYAALSTKLAKLQAYREEVLPRLQRAREMGDLSENGAYKAARFELSDTDREIRHLTRLIKYGRRVKPKNNDQASLGSHLTLLKPDQTKANYQLVGTYEADPLKGKISIESPVGQALIGKSVNAKVLGFTILAIS